MPEKGGALPAPAYGVGDVVGCHFDRVRKAVSYSLNGKIAGKSYHCTRRFLK